MSFKKRIEENVFIVLVLACVAAGAIVYTVIDNVFIDSYKQQINNNESHTQKLKYEIENLKNQNTASESSCKVRIKDIKEAYGVRESDLKSRSNELVAQKCDVTDKYINLINEQLFEQKQASENLAKLFDRLRILRNAYGREDERCQSNKGDDISTSISYSCNTASELKNEILAMELEISTTKDVIGYISSQIESMNKNISL